MATGLSPDVEMCFSTVIKKGESSLIAASENGHVEVVDKLLQHGATVDLQHQVHNTTCYTCNLFIHRQLTTCIIIIFLGWAECTDDSISVWTCGSGGQVITTWSQSGPYY